MDADKRPPSMVDVAKLAGVAHVTVSRVLNGHAYVKPETRERVERAIAQLGYARNDNARVLRSGRSGMLGVIIAGSQLFELPRVLLGVEQAANEAGRWVSLASWQSGEQDMLTTTVDRLIGQAAEGIAVIADRPVAVPALESMRARVPMTVVMSGDVPNASIGSVELDQVHGARLAARHLFELGHRHAVHLSGRVSTFDARARIDGWTQEATRWRGIRADILEGDFTAHSGFQVTRELMQRDERPTAIFAGNDQMAIGALAALTQAGLRVPEDVSLVGFDDMMGADFIVPPLTTVRQDFVQLGRISIEMLMEIIGGGLPRHHLIAPSLIVRASTAAPAAQS